MSYQARAESAADKPPTDPGQDGEPPPPPLPNHSPAPSPSALQLFASAFRRTFGMATSANSSGAAVTMRTKHDGHCKPRPVSEGVFTFGSLLGSVPPEASNEQRRPSRFAGSDPWGAGRDLPSLLEQVSFKARRDAAGVSRDDTATLPPRRRVNLFSSLRLRRREGSVSEGPDQDLQREIKTILTNLKNKASGQHNLKVSSSSEDEQDSAPSSQKPDPGRQRRRQEKMVAQQAKREQLKRLHRAQAIQRQLEEVAEKQRDVEERGVTIEKTIRGETEEGSPEMDDADEAQLYQSWFQLVLEKNRLARYESELMIFAQELELVDTQSRLQQDLRQRMLIEDTKKSTSELQEEQEILSEIIRTVEKRNQLVSVLEEQRLKERAEDKDLEGLLLSKGYEFHWSPADDSYGLEKLE